MKSLYDSLADTLGVPDPRPETMRPATDFDTLLDVSDPKVFCQKVLETREFRQYIMNGIALGDLPPAIMCRIIDHVWGKPPERVEHTGKDGAPIITEIRRAIVRHDAFDEEDNEQQQPKQVTH